MLGYAWKTLGWFLAGVAVALGFLLVPIQVAAERKKLDRTVAQIAQAHRDIRALETEFETRANLAQLDQWNNDTLRLVAPGVGQFVADESALAAIDVHQAGGIQTASFVPAPPVGESMAAAQAQTEAQPLPAAPVQAAAVVTKPTTALAAAAGAVKDNAVKRARVQAVAMLDRQLLSDSTVGDLLSGARAEARSHR